MPPLKFSCPQCRAPLRIEDSASLGTQFDCPDCGRALSLTDAPDGAPALRCVTSNAVPEWVTMMDGSSPAPSASAGVLPDDLADELRNIATAEADAKRKIAPKAS